MLPAGSFAVSERLNHSYHRGWTIKGQGDDKTEFFSPRGTMSATLLIFESPGFKLEGLRFRGNARPDGFGTDWYAAAVDVSLSPGGAISDAVVIDSWRALSINFLRTQKHITFVRILLMH